MMDWDWRGLILAIFFVGLPCLPIFVAAMLDPRKR